MSDTQNHTRIWARPEVFLDALRKRIAEEPTLTHQVIQVRFADLIKDNTTYENLLHFYNAHGPEACEPVETDIAVYFRDLRLNGRTQANGRIRDAEHDLLQAYLLYGSYNAEPQLSEHIISEMKDKTFGGVTLEPRVAMIEISPSEKNLKGLWQTCATLADHAVVSKELRHQRWTP